MRDMIEIRWHGRGGQGAKTAALLLADAALASGKYIQAFPEYGPERMGAPVASFNRISPSPIKLHSGVTDPDIVIVLDPTLMDSVDVTEGMPANGTLLVNIEKSPAEVKVIFGIGAGIKICTVDASNISTETIGRDIPNTPMLGALIKATGILDFKEMMEDMKKKLEKKFKTKPEVIAGNLKAIERAYNEVRI
ncbi:MAG: 2-oxoacid:acceptor oxidoreductase family protein [Candidatus Omnitrophica bacterium]|nr:2-oxoacid:acceptor oxidoreductase family protein [Candidatus Omnitrophota bacterium]MBU0895069.1 2-oxoacid:acceptor oxidoreductase family protein [Candidatus Omnitrophota bacterium]